MSESLKPGPELDALVAEKVFGERPPEGYALRTDGLWSRWVPTRYDDGSFTREVIEETWPLPYSTNELAAVKILEELPYAWALLRQPDHWEAQWCDDETKHGIAPTLPHSICLAALKAVGEDV